jgi:hypothetical protein
MDRPSAVIENAAVGRPRPRPARRTAQTIRIAVIAIGHLVALLCPASAVDPAEAAGGTVIAQLGKAAELLAFFGNKLAFVIIKIFQRLPLASRAISSGCGSYGSL